MVHSDQGSLVECSVSVSFPGSSLNAGTPWECLLDFCAFPPVLSLDNSITFLNFHVILVSKTLTSISLSFFGLTSWLSSFLTFSIFCGSFPCQYPLEPKIHCDSFHIFHTIQLAVKFSRSLFSWFLWLLLLPFCFLGCYLISGAHNLCICYWDYHKCSLISKQKT